MGRLASFRTVSTSTDSSPSAARATAGIGPPSPGARKAGPRVVTRLAAAWRATSEWVSHFLTTSRWRWIKLLADGVLLVAVMGAIGWAAVNGGYVAHRAADNRAQALVHLGGLPTVRLAAMSGKAVGAAPPTVVLNGIRSERISIAITNDGVDGVTIVDGTLTGPYFSSVVKLLPNKNHGFVAGSGTGLLVGTVTVDCDAAAPVSDALVGGRLSSAQPATALTVSVKDTNGTLHSVLLPIDTTAFAVQGRVCTK